MKVMIEKNERLSIDIKGRDENRKDIETFLIDRIPNPITLVSAFNQAEQLYGETRMYYYNGATTNCQRFVLDLLSVFGVQNNELLNAFVLQDATSLLNKYMAKFALFITDIAGSINYIQRGGELDDQDPDQDPGNYLGNQLEQYRGNYRANYRANYRGNYMQQGQATFSRGNYMQQGQATFSRGNYMQQGRATFRRGND
jgi:hypothetical protein